MLIKK
jgi:hypothetical protein